MASLDLQSLMHVEEAQRVGIDRMTEDQRQALAEWGLRMFGLGQVVVSNITAIKYGGRLIILEDGSRWAVDELDDFTADLWEVGGRVIVIDGEMFLLDDLERVAVQPEE
jgi:hypothetical protein